MPYEYILELLRARVAAADKPDEDGIVVSDGLTEPFIVERSWSGPAGYYLEQWSIRRDGKEILYEGDLKSISIRGLQSVSTFTDQVDAPIPLEAGTYQLAFVVEGRFMGFSEIRVSSKETVAA